ncbi:MAG TPA: class I SAM-dependent methyltransferase [Polyangiaceae bacterium]
MAKHENETAELYEQVWRRGTYSGFSRNTCGESSTPLLEAFLREVKSLGAKAPRIVELGAGSCDHAMRFAREGFPTTAVEYSRSAVTAARERARACPGLMLEIVQADLFAFTSQLPRRTSAGVYANAVFHFLTGEQRRSEYRILREALVDRGALAISFKAHGDALERRGSVVETNRAGAVVEGEDGIRRLFVASPNALAAEMRGEGYTVRQVIHWSVPNYNIAGESGMFVGILAARRDVPRTRSGA